MNDGTAGTANTGGGGGGVIGDATTVGKNGGSGIVIVRYLTSDVFRGGSLMMMGI